ncbi:hypothetical protein JVU11DRAFT_4430 [Chiua virens]|nr:hypothetical protein JVU11DRAFT_4430 [Chiua virens]
MSPLGVYLRILPRAHNPLFRAPARAFHSPFVVLNASTRLTSPASTPTSMYEKQDDTSTEPHLSSSGTRTYVVSEPDPSNTPYEVPSGAYPTSSPYVNYGPTSKENATVRNAEVPGEVNRRGGSARKISFKDSASAPGKL